MHQAEQLPVETELEQFVKIVIILVGVLADLVLLIWLGRQIRPAPFPAFPQP
jgi:hypothetical protein